ncbi:MAG: hypothetical protein ABW123_17565, partial [Cystobacter sp.]
REAIKDISGWLNIVAYNQWKKDVLRLLEDRYNEIFTSVEESLLGALAAEPVTADFFPSEGGLGRLWGDGRLEEMVLNVDGIEDVGPDAVIVPAMLHVANALIRVRMCRADAWMADDFVVVDAGDDDGYVDAEGYFRLAVKADLRVDLEVFQDGLDSELVVGDASVDVVTSICVLEPPWLQGVRQVALEDALRRKK